MQKYFRVYKSSAGSGKTYTLVKEYLKIVLINPSKVRNILAITFTNASAAEMKSRIISELGGIISLAGNNPNPKSRDLLNSIIRELHHESNAQVSGSLLISNASIVLSDILHKYSDFSISTIDSFAHRIVRTFAHDLGATSSFETELDTKNFLAKAVDLLISRSKAGEAKTDALREYLILQFDEELSIRIEDTLTKFAGTLFDEKTKPFLNQLRQFNLATINRKQKEVQARIAEIEQKVYNQANRAILAIHNAGLDQDAFLSKSKGIYGYFSNLKPGNISQSITPGLNVLKTINEGRWYPEKLPQNKKDVVDRLTGLLTEAYFAITGESGEVLQEYGMLLVIRQYLLPAGLLAEIHSTLDELKAGENILFISDFNQMISDAIAGEPVPYIYERLGEKFSHFMIDEFQDTSIVQWHNLLPLIDNGLATGNVSLVVGDAKQAIYRWRNGDVAQFANLPEISHTSQNATLQRFAEALSRCYQENSLDTNFRTRKNIVDFNNGFFSSFHEFLKEPLRKIYKNPNQKNKEGFNGGYVEVSFLAPSTDSDSSYDEATAIQVLEITRRLLQAGHSYSDIAIICRAKAKGSFLARYLLEAGIPVVSPESLLIKQAPEVVFVVALLKLLANRQDSIAAVECLNYLAWLMEGDDPNIVRQVLEQANTDAHWKHGQPVDWCRAIDILMEKSGRTFRLSQLGHQNLTYICNNIIQSFFAEQTPSAFVLFFMDVAFEFSQKHHPSLWDFLQWYEENGEKLSIALPQGINAVQITTIHKSKGLEFPVVIHPFFSLASNKLEVNQQWITPELQSLEGLPPLLVQISKKKMAGTSLECLYEEELNRSILDRMNLAYVAFTRAKEKLFVLAKQASPNKENELSVNNLLLQFVESFEGIEQSGSCFRFGSFDQKEANSVEAKKTQDYGIRRLYAGSPNLSVHAAAYQSEGKKASDSGRQRGKMLHKAMERISSIHSIIPVVDAMVAKGELSASEADPLKNNLTTLIQKPGVAECFSENTSIKRESGLFDTDGNFLRPDRVAFFADKTVVMDFKTGQSVPEHKAQIERYGSLLQQMGYPNVLKMLIYLDSGIVENV